jgi:hypothetical protein
MNMHRPINSALSDEELLRAWLSEVEEDELAPGSEPPFLVVYNRYRDAVREEMEQVGGLEAREAENRVGSVFFRAQDDTDIPPDTPLRDRLMMVARKVAADPHWTPDG